MATEKLQIVGGFSALPKVTKQDDGKVMIVVNGVWVANNQYEKRILSLLAEAKASGEFDGVDGVSVEHSFDGTVLTIKSASGVSSVDLKGQKGDPFTYKDFTEEQLAGLKGDPFTYDDFTEEQRADLKGEPFTYEDFTEEQLAELKGEPFRYEDFTEEQLEGLKPKMTDYVLKAEFDDLAKPIANALMQSGMTEPLETETAYATRATANGARVVDGSKATLRKVVGNTVDGVNATFGGIKSTSTDGKESVFTFPKTELPIGATIDLEKGIRVDEYHKLILDGVYDDNTDYSLGDYLTDGFRIRRILTEPYTVFEGFSSIAPVHNQNGTFGLSGSGDNLLWVGGKTVTGCNTTSEFLEYLKSNPITLYYKVTTPKETPFTDEQKAAANQYTVWENGTETVLGNDGAEVGATPTLSQGYTIVNEMGQGGGGGSTGGGLTESEVKAIVNSSITGKQDKLTFDGTYNASINPVATVNTVTEKIAAVVAGADESFNTLKEIADWIKAHPDDVSALNSSIQANAGKIAENTATLGTNAQDIADLKKAVGELNDGLEEVLGV